MLPVDPAPDGVGRLAVAQALAELHEGDKGKAPGRIGGLAELGVEVSEVGVGEHGPELVPQERIRVAAPERGPGDAGGVVGHRRERLRRKRHGRPPRQKPTKRRHRPKRSGLRQQGPSDTPNATPGLRLPDSHVQPRSGLKPVAGRSSSSGFVQKLRNSGL